MNDPVMSKDGKNFEKKAILDWLTRGNVNCPLTRQPLRPSLLVPNANLQLKINQWKKTNGVTEMAEDDDDASTSSQPNIEFLGMVQIDENSRDANNNYDYGDADVDPSSSSRRDAKSPVDPTYDDLADLLQLYNEVLELTDAPLGALPTSRLAPLVMPNFPAPPPSTQATEDAALGAFVAHHTARRAWRPKLFPGKKTTSTDNTKVLYHNSKR